jgi:hypothetical protein
MFLDEKIACGERQPIPLYKAGIFEAILGMQRAGDGTTMAAKVFGSYQYQVVDSQSYGEMCGILELVAYVAAKVGHMPAHSKGSHRT